MSLDKNFIENLIDITSKAAISCYPHLGKKNKTLADKAATDVMRFNLNKLNIDGEVVIGEGELDQAPMLYIGENLGNKKGQKIDIAVDPVEGTNFVAKNLPGAISVLAISEKGNLFKAPETYMDKIAFGQNIPKDVIDLDSSIEKNLKNLSDFKNKNIEDISVCLLDRPRHAKIIETLKKFKTKIKLITDGDVTGALLVSNEKYDVDIFLGVGGGPEGVIAASALDAMNCNFQGRFIFESDEDKSRAKKMGIKDLNKKYELKEIVKGDSIFCATGITTGDLINGIQKEGKSFITETLNKYLFIGINNIGLKLSVLHWINDALMAIFFFFVTLEIKREFIQGELSNIKQAMLPIIGAVGGMLVPALIYVVINIDNPKICHNFILLRALFLNIFASFIYLLTI